MQRLVIDIFVNEDQICAETNKSRAFLKNPKTGKKISPQRLTQLVKEATKQHYQPIGSIEDELLGQLDDILKGKKYFNPSLLDELYYDLNDDIYEQLNGDHDKLKLFYESNLEYQSSQDGNEVDFVISKADWLIEGKPAPPETDDKDQIVKYIAFRKGIKMMSTVAVSDPNDKKAQPYTKKNHLGFPKALVSRFTTELKAKLSHHEDLKDLKINMIDLRYYELHKLI